MASVIRFCLATVQNTPKPHSQCVVHSPGILRFGRSEHAALGFDACEVAGSWRRSSQILKRGRRHVLTCGTLCFERQARPGIVEEIILWFRELGLQSECRAVSAIICLVACLLLGWQWGWQLGWELDWE